MRVRIRLEIEELAGSTIVEEISNCGDNEDGAPFNEAIARAFRIHPEARLSWFLLDMMETYGQLWYQPAGTDDWQRLYGTIVCEQPKKEPQ